MDEVKTKRPTYSDESKRDAVRLVVEEGYSFKAACGAVGVCDATLRAWHRKLAPPTEPCGDGATVDELRDEVERLRKQLKRAELEREILPLDRSTLGLHISQVFFRFLGFTVRGVRRSRLIWWT